MSKIQNAHYTAAPSKKAIKAAVKSAVAAKPSDPTAYKAALKASARAAFHWNKDKEKAAFLISEDRLSLPQIAKKLSVNMSTLNTWRKHEVFIARVLEQEAAWKERVLNSGIAAKENRIRRLGELLNQVEAVRSSRANYYRDKKNVPGGETGLVAVSYKFRNRKDGSQQKIIEAALDKSMIDAERQIMADVAKETGGSEAANIALAQQVVIREYVDVDTSRV